MLIPQPKALFTSTYAKVVDQHLYRLLFLIALLAVFVFRFSGSMPTAGASPMYSCDGVYCHYHMYGTSGSGANGTRGTVTTPQSVSGISNSNLDTLALSTWAIGTGTGGDSSLEAGEAYGFGPYCGTFVAYFHPYGTKDDGTVGDERCDINLGMGNSYLVSAYHSGNHGKSRVQSGGTIVYDHDWGTYTWPLGYDNVAMYEVWGAQGQSVPSWGASSIGGLQWENSSGSWAYWGYLNGSTDDQNGCPYFSNRLSSTAFQGYKTSGC
jgi:hypothetical protein